MSGFQMKFKKRNPDFKKPPKKVPTLQTAAAGYPLERRPGSSTKPDRQTAVASSDSSSEEDFVELKKIQQAKDNEEKHEQAAIVERALLEQVMNGQLNLMDLLSDNPAAKGLLTSKLTPEMLKELQSRESVAEPQAPPHAPPQSRESHVRAHTREHSREHSTEPHVKSRQHAPPQQQKERRHKERPAPPAVTYAPPAVTYAPPVVAYAPPAVTYSPHTLAAPHTLAPVVTRASVASISSESDSASECSISSESYTDSDDTENPIKLKKTVKKLRSSNKKLKKSVKKMKKKIKAKDKTILDLQGAVAVVPVKEQRRANVVKPQVKQKPPEESKPSERSREPAPERSRDTSERSREPAPERSRDTTERSRDNSHRSRDDSHRSRDDSRRDSPSRKQRKHRTERTERPALEPEVAPAAPTMMAALPNQQIYDPQTGQYRTVPSMQVPMGPMPTLSALGMMPPLSSVARPPLLACPPGPPPSIASLLTPSLLPTPSEDDLYSDVFNSSPPKREVRSFTEVPRTEPKVRTESGGDSTERDSRGYPLCSHCNKFHSKNVRCRKQAMKQAQQIKSKTEMKKMSALLSDRERELSELKKKKELRERIKADSFARQTAGYNDREYSARSDVYDIDDVDQDMDGECLDGEEYNG